MDLSTLNLTQEQLTELTSHIETEVNTTKETYKEFISKEDATKLTQSETDKVRTNYVKQIKEFEDKLKGLTPPVRTEEQLATDARILALEGREQEMLLKEKLLNTTNMLQAQGLPSELAKYLQGAESVETEITSLKGIFDAMKLDNSYIPNSHKNNNDSMTKEQFKALSYTDRTKLYASNIELFKKLSAK